MRTTTLPKAMRAVREILRIDRFSPHRHRSLDQFVLKRRLADWVSASLVLLDPYTLDWCCLLQPAAESLVEVPQVLFAVLGIHLRRSSVNPRGA